MRRILFGGLLVLILGGCASTNVCRDVLREEPVNKSRDFAAPAGTMYDAVIRMTFKKNFVVDHEDRENGSIVAKRFFKKGKRNIVLALQARVVPLGEGQSEVFLNAVQTTERMYVADRTRFFLFIIPLPGGGGREASQVKEGEQIVEDQAFYDDLFGLISAEVDHARARAATAASAGQVAAPEDPTVLESVPVSPAQDSGGTVSGDAVPAAAPLPNPPHEGEGDTTAE